MSDLLKTTINRNYLLYVNSMKHIPVSYTHLDVYKRQEQPHTQFIYQHYCGNSSLFVCPLVSEYLSSVTPPSRKESSHWPL